MAVAGTDEWRCWRRALATIAATVLTVAALPGAAMVKKKTTVSKAGKAAIRRKAHSAAATYQQHPDPERYKQIQQALAERGYYKGEVNGEWSADATDALRRFQTDQKLNDDGKITALSLTALGLGPRHDGSTAAAAPAPAAAEVTAEPPKTVPPDAEPPK